MVDHLRAGLGRGYDVRFPLMPHPDAPRYEAWRDRLEDELAALPAEAHIVTHSLGGSMLLKTLAERPHDRAIAGMFLVATPHWNPADPEIAEYALPDDFAARLPAIRRLFLYHSRDDTEIPLAHVERYARALPQAVVRDLDGYGHLFDKPCPELVRDIVV
jgi:uncharacterized protein